MKISRKEFEDAKRKQDTPLEKRILDFLGQNKDAYELKDMIKALEPESVTNLGLSGSPGLDFINPVTAMQFNDSLHKLEKEGKILKATSKGRTYYTIE